MDDDQILARGGTQKNIDRAAHNNGACGAISGGTCDYCGKTDAAPQPSAGSEELREQIRIIHQRLHGRHDTHKQVAKHSYWTSEELTNVLKEDDMLFEQEIEHLITAQNDALSHTGGRSMSIEIKFRAWDGKQIIPYEDMLLYDSRHETPTSFVMTLQGKPYDYQYMQYIGLKDKNGVEIYEGDIVNVPFGHYKYNANEESYESKVLDTIPCKIVFSEWLGFYPKPLIGKKVLQQRLGKRRSLWGHVRDEEVIGNVYANPELLK